MLYREAKKEDYTSFYKLRSEKNNLFWTGYEAAPDFEKFQLWYNDRLKDEKRKIYLYFEGDQIIGYLNFDIYKNHVAIGYGVDSSLQGKGYGSKIVASVFEIAEKHELNVKRIIAWISEVNIGSQKVVEKNNFTQSKESEKRKRFDRIETYYLYEYLLEQSQ